MNTEDIINELYITKDLAPETIEEVENNSDLRLNIVQYFDNYKNRNFALEFLLILTNWRLDEQKGISGNSLMLACYILGKHNQIEDCIKVWKTKCLDFDTFNYIDVQLIPYCGFEKTIEYLKTQKSTEAQNALSYLIECNETGDFDDLEEYYNEIPWFI
ncbi:MAG: hypothetical protein K1X55_11385 [Chitinophagales bacterium]|nr:hypothetical protein [Chitinophagales bacterium]